MPDSLSITRPDDWHCHLRDGEVMASVVGATARQFARAIVMPNLKPPVVDVKQATEYRGRILAALPKGSRTAARITIMLLLGLRPCEIMRIQAPYDWHRAAKTLYVRTAKGGRPRTLPLDADATAALELLDTHPKGGWGTFTSAPAARMFKAAIGKAGLGHYLAHGARLVPYSMRHTFATNAYALTGDIEAVSLGIGHKTLQQTHRYVEAAVSAQVGSMFGKVSAARPEKPAERADLRAV